LVFFLSIFFLKKKEKGQQQRNKNDFLSNKILNTNQRINIVLTYQNQTKTNASTHSQHS